MKKELFGLRNWDMDFFPFFEENNTWEKGTKLKTFEIEFKRFIRLIVGSTEPQNILWLFHWKFKLFKQIIFLIWFRFIAKDFFLFASFEL